MMRSLFCLIAAAVTAIPALPWNPELQGQQQHLAVSDEAQSSLNRDKFTRLETFGFNINWRNYFDHLTIQEDVAADLFPAGLNGAVRLAAGERGQPDDFLVLVRVIASSEAALSAISITNTTGEVHVTSSSPDDIGRADDHATVDVIIFTRPGALQFGTTTLSSNTLDIHIDPDIRYETYNMYLRSKVGTIHGIDDFGFVAHTINITTSGNGAILGRWALPATMALSTSQGPIDIILTPKRWSSGPATNGDLDARSSTGNITINMPFDKSKLSLRNGTTRIETEASIAAQLVHSAGTHLNAGGDIDVSLLPYWAFYEWQGVQHNVISTESQKGHTNLRVLSPEVDTYYRTNPLWFSISHHRQGKEGQGLSLSYPGEWAGHAEGRGKNVEITGEEFERLEGNETVVRARRRPVGSQLVFESEEAPATLELEPCQDGNEYCSWQKRGGSEEL